MYVLIMMMLLCNDSGKERVTDEKMNVHSILLMLVLACGLAFVTRRKNVW